MNNRYAKLAKIFSEGELILLEDAIQKYTPSKITDEDQKFQNNLKSDITLARR